MRRNTGASSASVVQPLMYLIAQRAELNGSLIAVSVSSHVAVVLFAARLTPPLPLLCCNLVSCVVVHEKSQHKRSKAAVSPSSQAQAQQRSATTAAVETPSLNSNASLIACALRIAPADSLQRQKLVQLAAFVAALRHGIAEHS